MFYLGCHLVDLVLQIQGLPEEVIPFNTATGIDEINTEDLGFAVLKYPHAVSVIRTGGTEVDGFNRRQLVICGSNETLEIRPLEVIMSEEKYGKKFLITTKQRKCSRDEDGKTTTTESESEINQRYEKMLLSFADMVRGEKENPYTLDYELELFKVIMKCCGVKDNER